MKSNFVKPDNNILGNVSEKKEIINPNRLVNDVEIDNALFWQRV